MWALPCAWLRVAVCVRTCACVSWFPWARGLSPVALKPSPRVAMGAGPGFESWLCHSTPPLPLRGVSKEG